MKRIVTLLAVMPMMALATTWYVNGSGGLDSNSGASASLAKATIQAAIDASADGDTILVAPGTYAPITTDNKAITIKSLSGSLSTVIDGGGISRCATLSANGAPTYWISDENNIAYRTVLKGFTIRNGYRPNERVDDSSGGGVIGGTLEDCIVQDCSAYGCGGCLGSLIKRCIITGNIADDDGGGVGHSVIYDSLIYGNRANNSYGGKSGSGVSRSKLVNCTVTANVSVRNESSSSWGPGAAVDYSAEAHNCIIYGNKFSDGLTIYNGHSADVDEGTGEGSSLDNCYTSNPNFVDAANGDYRLAAGSPCIDAGDNSYVTTSTDLDGNARIANGAVDIGCYEYGSLSAVDSLADGLVAYYPFDGNANDASGNGNNGVVHGATLTADRFGNANGAYYLDGNSYVEVSNSDSLYAIDRTVTISAWIKPEAWYPGDGYISFDKWLSIVNKGYNDRQFGIQIESDYGTKWLFSDNAHIDSVLQLPSIGMWNHVVITDDGTTMTAWLNGQSIGTASSGGSLPQTTESLYIGMDRPAGLEYFNGAMDDIRIYNRALSATEVRALYDGTAVTPVAYTVTFDLNGAGGAAPSGRSIAHGAAIGELPDVARTGYSFDGWFTAASGGTKISASTIVTDDVTYYAHWIIESAPPTTFTVTFNANGGSGGWSRLMAYRTVIVVPTVTRTGYTFAGWTPAVAATVPECNVTYTAQWEVNQYTVTFDANGGVGGTIVTEDYGTTLVAPTVTRTGYTFMGWSPSVPSMVPAGNATYVAQWEVLHDEYVTESNLKFGRVYGGGWWDVAVFEHEIWDNNDIGLYGDEYALVPVTGTGTINPVIYGDVPSGYLDVPEVWTDQKMFDTFTPNGLPTSKWKVDEDYENRWRYETANEEWEWPMDIWPDKKVVSDRRWIVVHAKEKNVWSGVWSFRVGLAGTSEISDPIILVSSEYAECNGLRTKHTPSDFMRGIIFSGYENFAMWADAEDCYGYFSYDSRPRMQTFEIENWNAAKMGKAMTLMVAVPAAGTLVMSSTDDEDDSPAMKKVFSIKGTGIVSDTEIVKSNDYNSPDYRYNVTNFWKASGASHFRRVEVSGATTLTFTCNTDECACEFNRMYFFPKNVKSVAIDVGYIAHENHDGAYDYWGRDYVQGYVTGAGVYKSGETATLKATSGDGEEFDHWVVRFGNLTLTDAQKTSPTLSFKVTDAMCGAMEDEAQIFLSAIWKPKYKVTALPSIVGAGTVTGTGRYYEGARVTLTATANKGYEFVKWSDGVTAATRTVNVVAADVERIVYACFMRNGDPIDDDDPIESFVPGTKVEVDTGLIGYKAKGLPPGLKLNKKTGVISGAPKKPGTYVASFTKKGEDTVTMTFVVDPFPTISIAMEGDTEKCKVTGASKPGKGYAVGKKVNLAAKAPKGTAFVGWFMDGMPWPNEATYLVAKQKYVMTMESLSLVARFEKEEILVSCLGLSSQLVVGKAVSLPIEIETQSGVKSVKGVKLPKGLKVKKVDDVWYVMGTPKKKGTFSAEIKVTAKSGAVEKLPVVVIVGDSADVLLPDWAVGTFHGWECWIEQGEDETNLDMDLQLVDIGRNGSFVTWSGIQQGWVDDQDRVGRWWSVHYPEDYLPTRQDDGSFVWSSTSPIKGVHSSDTKSAMQTITVSKFMYGNAEIGVLKQDAYFSFESKRDPDVHQHAELIQDPWSLATRPEHLPDFSSTGEDVLTLRFWSYYGEFSTKLTFAKEGNVNVEWSLGDPQTTYARLMPYRYDSEQGLCHATLPIISGGGAYGWGIILDLTIPHPDTASAADVGCSITASSWQVYELKSAEMME